MADKDNTELHLLNNNDEKHDYEIESHESSENSNVKVGGPTEVLVDDNQDMGKGDLGNNTEDQYASNQQPQIPEGKGRFHCGCQEGTFRYPTYKEVKAHGLKEHGPTHNKVFLDGIRVYHDPEITTTTRQSRSDPTNRDHICGCGKEYTSMAALYTHIK